MLSLIPKLLWEDPFLKYDDETGEETGNCLTVEFADKVKNVEVEEKRTVVHLHEGRGFALAEYKMLTGCYEWKVKLERKIYKQFE